MTQLLDPPMGAQANGGGGVPALTDPSATEPQQQEDGRDLAAPNGGGRGRMTVVDDSPFANLLDTGRFEHMWRVAQMFASSSMIPAHFQRRPQDCFVGIQMAIRLGVDPLMFLQNCYIHKGKPGMEGKFAIALVNSSGLFDAPLRFEFAGKGDEYGCYAWTKLKHTGERVEGPRVTIGTAKAEGWHQNNRKWTTIPELMLTYRAGAWFGRAKCPERLMGMQTVDELRDTSGRGGDPNAAAAEAGQMVSRTRQVLAKVTGRPVSEGQTFTPEPDAEQQVSRQDDETPAARAEEAAQGEPVPDPEAEPPPGAEYDLSTHEKFLSACREHAIDAGVPEAKLNDGIKAWALKLGKKGKENQIPEVERRKFIDEFFAVE